MGGRAIKALPFCLGNFDCRFSHSFLFPSRRNIGFPSCTDFRPIVFLLLLGGKVISEIPGLYPIIGQFRQQRDERWYYALMMSTGVTFGTILALYGLSSHNIASREQYSSLIGIVITSAVATTLIPGLALMPRHLLPKFKKNWRNACGKWQKR